MVKKMFLLVMVLMFLTSTAAVMAVNDNAPGFLEGETVNAQLDQGIQLSQPSSGVVGLSDGVIEADLTVIPDVARERVREQFPTNRVDEPPRIIKAMINNQERIVYEFEVERKAKILNLFNTKIRSQAQVPVDSEQVYINNPWWAALATIEGE